MKGQTLLAMNYTLRPRSHHLVLFGVAVSFLSGVLFSVHVDWAAVGSDHRLLKDKAIVAVGTVAKEEYTNIHTLERIEWYEFKESVSTDFCFTMPTLTLWGYGEKAALVLVDADENYYVGFFESKVGSVAVELQPIVVISCP